MTSTIETVEKVLKTDTAGRVRTPLERRAHLLEEFDRSGLSGAKFAALAGISYSTFAGWVQRRRKNQGVPSTAAKPVDPVRWLEAVVAGETSSSQVVCALKLHLPGGAWVELATPKEVVLAAALVRAMEKTC